MEILRENQTGLHHLFKTHRDDGEARIEYWSISGNYINRHHVEPRVKLYVPRRIIPNSTEIYRRYQNYRHDVGCDVGGTY